MWPKFAALRYCGGSGSRNGSRSGSVSYSTVQNSKLQTYTKSLNMAIVPDRISGKCLDSGIQGTSPGNSVCVESEQPKPSPVHPDSPKEQQ